jgi:hypothetical protein
LVESGDIWIVDLLVDLSLPLVNRSRSAVPCVRTQEEQRLAGVEGGFKVAMLSLGLQQVIVKTSQGVAVGGAEGLPAPARVGRGSGGLGTTGEFSGAVVDRGGAVGVVGPAHFRIVLLSRLEDGGYVVLDCEVGGDPPLLMKKLGFPAVSLPGAHLQ